MAASISLTRSFRPRDPVVATHPFRLASPFRFGRSFPLFRNRSSRSPSASMSVQAPKKSPDLEFLDRRDSGILHFVKYHGLGNDFIMLCNRNIGVGADGVIFVLPGVNDTDYTMRIFNSDGSEPEVSCSFGDSPNFP
ncbi:hypothetical protein BHE74_00027497 [Ensete ventricosum]|nr:hypothetical protein GW17_00006539 [Ensete ventricosum]RWW65208.1 hypothetical protein BHE74_00027497 [Ensete ventricosum]RZR80479.1 hypothetical protein BHM03_00006543 [Ensete ventricosum]